MLEKKSKGFTLVEMLVTLFIFSITFGAASGLFVSAIKNQSRTLASQQLLDQTSYLIEYMGRALRMARKDDIDYGDGAVNCLSGDKVNFATTTGGIKFRNYNNQCQEFYRECAGEVCRLKEKKGPVGSEIENYLTSPNLYVESFNIGPSDSWDQDDNLQPRVTMFLEIRKAGAGSQPKIKIQTTISQRELDIQQ
ncbi:prepilin-type N-terminal cleavage/methylation domain-containing protein [Patescibacteria group bacterium]|nr:prepilin-type N-terminal cleavage/methylation domain-containing protein [Patescibacteria group bacterium]